MNIKNHYGNSWKMIYIVILMFLYVYPFSWPNYKMTKVNMLNFIFELFRKENEITIILCSNSIEKNLIILFGFNLDIRLHFLQFFIVSKFLKFSNF